MSGDDVRFVGVSMERLGLRLSEVAFAKRGSIPRVSMTLGALPKRKGS